LQNNSQNIISSLNFLREIITQRLNIFFQKKNAKEFSFPKPVLHKDASLLNQFFLQKEITVEEYTILLLALFPHIQPDLLDSIVQQFITHGGDFPEIGGIKSGNSRSTLPTGETAVFILAGNDLQQRLFVQQIFSLDHFFYKEKILWLEDVKEGESKMSGRIILSGEYRQEWLFGKNTRQHFGPDFPAKYIETKMIWDDLVLNNITLNQINDIQTWMNHNKTVMQDEVLGKKIKPGYRALFYGPPGTGKTMTATLLGKQFNKEVYRIDLSQIVSKYIGETEKNLEKVFSKAESKDWILFFDEADALFGKRTNVQNSHDRYANQEVSYLLQRVEDYAGLLILASNFKSNMDEAFLRRFHTTIHFPLPAAAERFLIWQKTIPSRIPLDAAVNLKSIAEKYEISGSAILSAVHYAALRSAAEKDKYIRNNYLLEGIKKEFRKEDRPMN
jgi:hypothetical protein